MAASDSTGKRCGGCKVVKPLLDFYTQKGRPDGLRTTCKACNKLAGERWRKANMAAVAAAARARQQRDPDGFRAIQRKWQNAKYANDPEFRERAKTRAKARASKKIESDLAAAARRRSLHREEMRNYCAAYYAAHATRIKEQTRQYAKENKGARRHKNAERSMRHLSAKRRAVPAWADRDAIHAFYAEAGCMTTKTGGPHHVDHIVPLQHPLVCGLHVETNLQVLPGPENQSKGNRYWPDCPDEILLRVIPKPMRGDARQEFQR